MDATRLHLPSCSRQGPHSLAQGALVLWVLVQEHHDVQEALDIPVGRGQGETSPQLWAGPLPTDSAAFTLALSLMWAPRGAALADNGITNPLPPCP